jgi:hypothetical protein
MVLYITFYEYTLVVKETRFNNGWTYFSKTVLLI